MNIPNIITVVRLILVPVLVTFILSGKDAEAFVVFFIASFTDYLDGYIARRSGKVTKLGKFMDPLADKSLVMSALVCFVYLRQINVIAVILMLVREFAVISVRLVASSEGRVVSANFWGKAKTIIQILTVLLVLLTNMLYRGVNYAYEYPLIITKEIFLWLSVAVSWISGLIYIYENYDLIKDTD